MSILHFEKVTKFSPCKIEIGINIHDCQPNLEMAIYVLKSGNGNDILYIAMSVSIKPV